MAEPENSRKSQSSNIQFYTALSKGEVQRNIWGLESRFKPSKVAMHPSIVKYMIPVLKKFITKEQTVLDFGCGPGTFFPILSTMCANLVGTDVVPNFVESADKLIQSCGLENTQVHSVNTVLGMYNHKQPFDVVFMFDVIHHLENPFHTIDLVFNLLKEEGILLIFEPNKLNPMLALMCLLDKNEQQLLRMGSFSYYRRLLTDKFSVSYHDWNGTLVGPSSWLARTVDDLLEHFPGGFFRWLLPKLVIVAHKNVER